MAPPHLCAGSSSSSSGVATPSIEFGPHLVSQKCSGASAASRARDLDNQGSMAVSHAFEEATGQVKSGGCTSAASLAAAPPALPAPNHVADQQDPNACRDNGQSSVRVRLTQASLNGDAALPCRTTDGRQDISDRGGKTSPASSVHNPYECQMHLVESKGVTMDSKGEWQPSPSGRLLLYTITKIMCDKVWNKHEGSVRVVRLCAELVKRNSALFEQQAGGTTYQHLLGFASRHPNRFIVFRDSRGTHCIRYVGHLNWMDGDSKRRAEEMEKEKTLADRLRSFLAARGGWCTAIDFVTYHNERFEGLLHRGDLVRFIRARGSAHFIRFDDWTLTIRLLK